MNLLIAGGVETIRVRDISDLPEEATPRSTKTANIFFSNEKKLASIELRDLCTASNEKHS
jgi:hypothetical protein